MSLENIHVPVLPGETIEFLNAVSGGVFVDATLGLGGHTELLLAATNNNVVIAIDQDEEAIKLAAARLEPFADRIRISHSNFSQIKGVLAGFEIESVDGIMADLGVSSLQLDSEERGFSFRFDAPLDMRMNKASEAPTAAELLASLSETEIANLIYTFGEERFSRRIARRIVERRESGEPVTTTKQLAEIAERSVKRSPKDKIHPATRTFQALRIAVNHETEILEQFIADAVDLLKPEGRLVVIAFHSLEDRIVKQMFQKLSGRCFCPPRIPQCVCGAKKQVEILTRKPVIAGEEETETNPRARSAKLRAVRKLESSC
ncbi:MAG TPA: 16S rRNA (cytosine(1402)-N(4))-methyltransferase RsmH [Pyrinomonadaceae bacterium]|nr:16S rRNA (cytosine(1402)-N(4))-methyltransferase RsmH [Pyrinomonadaceae bacterium]